jgi:hypothetical protein
MRRLSHDGAARAGCPTGARAGAAMNRLSHDGARREVAAE